MESYGAGMGICFLTLPHSILLLGKRIRVYLANLLGDQDRMTHLLHL